MEKDLYGEMVPLLVIEVMARGNRTGKLLRKIELILSLGTAEVWLVYPERKLVESHSANCDVKVIVNWLPVPGYDLTLDLHSLFEAKRQSL